MHSQKHWQGMPSGCLVPAELPWQRVMLLLTDERPVLQRVYFLNLEEPQWVPTLGLSETDWEFLREGENHAAREILRAEWAQLQEDRQVSPPSHHSIMRERVRALKMDCIDPVIRDLSSTAKNA